MLLNYTHRTCVVCGRVFHTALTTTVCRVCGSLSDLPPVDPRELDPQACVATDAVPDGCACPDCLDQETEDVEATYASGYLAPTSARTALARIDRERRS